MGHHAKRHAAGWVRTIAIVLVVILVLLCVVLYLNYRGLRRSQIFTAHQLRLNALWHRGPLPVSDASVIRPWMTFDYINKVFLLPPGYLITSLHIKDPAYPRLTLSRYARTQGLTATAFVEKVRSAVRAFAPGTP